LFLALALAGCTAGNGRAASPSVALVGDERPAGTVAEVPSRLPPFAFHALPAGKGPLSERLFALLSTFIADPALRAIVVLPAPEGSLAAMARTRELRKDLIWVLAEPGDDSLAAEAAADLVVELAGAEAWPALSPEATDALSRGLCELARRAGTGKARIDDREEILAAFSSIGGWDWKVAYSVDPASGVKARNHVIVTATPKK